MATEKTQVTVLCVNENKYKKRRSFDESEEIK